jgi:hypothetical protein
MGTRRASMRSFLQMRQPAGKITLISASLASTSQPRTPRRRSSAFSLLEFTLNDLPSATQAALYYF